MGLVDFISLIISLFIILPVVSLVRELGYLFTSKIFGAKETKVTIGSGPVVCKLGVFEVRRYYFTYSWCSYKDLKKDSKLTHMIIYASPIISTLFMALIVNSLLVEGILEANFWHRFVFYAFYFVLFDAIPIYYPDGQPSNGRVVYDLIRYGRKTDFTKNDPQSKIKK